MSRQRSRQQRVNVPRHGMPLTNLENPRSLHGPMFDGRLHTTHEPAHNSYHHLLPGQQCHPSSVISSSSSFNLVESHQQRMSANTRLLSHSVANLHHSSIADGQGRLNHSPLSHSSLNHSPMHHSPLTDRRVNCGSSPDTHCLQGNSYYVKSPEDAVFPLNRSMPVTPKVSTLKTSESAGVLLHYLCQLYSYFLNLYSHIPLAVEF